MGLVLQLVETGADARGRGVDVLEIDRPGGLRDIANLGLTLSEAKQLLARVQQAVVAVQARDHAALRPECSICGATCHVKDWQSRQIATLFGTVVVRLPRFRCPGCGRSEAGTSWPAHCRSTPELDQLQAHLSALMAYRVATGVLAHLLPVAAGTSHETLRDRTLKLGKQLRHAAAVSPEPAMAAAPASAITLSLDSTFIRSCHEGGRHLEVRVGNAEAPEGGSRQVFGAVVNGGTDVVALIRRTLDTLGRAGDTALTAFTDGCSGLRAILAAAGITGPPSLDWFHLSMRLQHAKQVAEVLPADAPDQQQAKAEIVTEVERLRWRAWNGKAKDARITLKRLRTLLPTFKGEPIRKLKQALRAVDRYLRSQSAWLINYAERRRAGLRVGTSLTEGTANFLVNRRMAKSQQMRWSRRGADLLLQVRCAVYNGAFGCGFGQLFEPTPGSGLHWAEAA
jgi:hypothetical protein